jgi:hypothetical protein
MTTSAEVDYRLMTTSAEVDCADLCVPLCTNFMCRSLEVRNPHLASRLMAESEEALAPPREMVAFNFYVPVTYILYLRNPSVYSNSPSILGRFTDSVRFLDFFLRDVIFSGMLYFHNNPLFFIISRSIYCNIQRDGMKI